jgi:hypothetical protein
MGGVIRRKLITPPQAIRLQEDAKVGGRKPGRMEQIGIKQLHKIYRIR